MPQNSAPCFEFENVSFAWPGGKTILDGQSFSLPKGVFAVVRGPSGSGKSTLLRLMNRLEEPVAGEIRYLGRSLNDWSPPLLRQKVAYLHQMPVVPDLSVRETLCHAFTFNINKALDPPGDSALTAQLERVGLGDVGLGDPAAALSGGQRQRLCLLRAVATGPDVLLLDEPTASLDKESKTVVEEMAGELCAGGTTVVMVTHDDFIPGNTACIEVRVRDGRVEICQ